MTVPTTLQPGDEVYVWAGVVEPFMRFARITEHRPQNGGYLARPSGTKSAFGWGYNEMIPIPEPGQCWWDRENRGWKVVIYEFNREASTVVTNVGSWTLVAFGRTYRPAPPTPRSRWQRLMES